MLRHLWSQAWIRDQRYYDRLVEDAPFLTSNGRLSEHLVDKIILQLNRVYPQVLTDKEAEKFRNPKTRLQRRLSELLRHLQRKGDKDCQEFYRALQSNADWLYILLPSRSSMMRPAFFFACFSVAAGLAFLMYCYSPDVKNTTGVRKVVGFSALGFGRHVKNVLISYMEDTSKKKN
ncbi:caspase recruitment domain-containing protein 19 isoform X3 [Ambystoma mexicanum]|uniref:caspase recruitment domain-containing protein 19 isoform X3 n=1 Tax=Ambystoma mexicanum TaxID=8296 RepID=UPI0037E719A5